MLPAARDIALMMPVPQMLRQLGWRTRDRNRADCGLCKGNSKGTVAFTEHLWHCHRCHAGGTVYGLVMQSRRCEFRDALRYVAELAGVRLGDYGSETARHEVTARRQHRERIERAADGLGHLERSLRIECRDRIHQCDRVLATPGPWSEAHWQRAWAAFVLRDEYLLPEYTLLSFGAIPERTRYILADDRVRAKMAAAIRRSGGVRTEDGCWREVLE
jgi:hypothetical protein